MLNMFSFVYWRFGLRFEASYFDPLPSYNNRGGCSNSFCYIFIILLNKWHVQGHYDHEIASGSNTEIRRHSEDKEGEAQYRQKRLLSHLHNANEPSLMHYD